MNLHHVIAKDIIGWIRDFHSGLKKNYLLCKDDTKTTIGLLKNLPYVALTTEMEVFDWFENELDMDMSNTGSLYRAFIVYNRDEIVNLRVSTHYSTKSSFRNAAAAKGESEFEYHIIITRTPLALKSDSITGDMMIDSTEIFVAEIQLCDFLSNPSERWKTISKLIKLLTDGSSMNESKRTSTNIKTIRLTETELKKVIAESVKRVVRGLNEKKEDHSYKPIGSQTFYTNNGKIEHKSIVTLQAPSGQVCHIAEDDHCYVLYNGSGIHYDGDGLKDKNCEMIHYIFPEAFKALKELPLL